MAIPKERINRYLNFLNEVYSGIVVSNTLYSKHKISAVAGVSMKQNNWLRKTKDGWHWALREYPDATHAIHLINDIKKINKEYADLRLKKANQAIQEIPLNHVKESIEKEERFTWSEWLERLKDNPMWEYRLTRIRRVSEPEVIL